MDHPRPSASLVVIGGGNMARAIVGGAVTRAVMRGPEVIVCDPDKSKWPVFYDWGVHCTASHADALGLLGDEGQVLLAVKPQSLDGAAAHVRPVWPSRSVVVISILAGIRSERVKSVLGSNIRVVRAMPNLAASIGHSVTALCAGAGAHPGDEKFAARLFEEIGPLVIPIREEMMDAFTAVAASGPAYVFYLAEAMIKAAQEVGFDAATAHRAVIETIAGAAALMSTSKPPPGALREAVTSKGGTTEAAVGVLNERGVAEAISAAIKAARDRGVELAG